MKEDLTKIKGKCATVLKTDDYVFMEYLIDGKPWYLDIESTDKANNSSLVGNIYKGRVKNTTVSGMTFADIGVGEDVMIGGTDFYDGEYLAVQVVSDKHDGKTFKASSKITFSSSLVILETSTRRKEVKKPRRLIKYAKELSSERIRELCELEKDIVDSIETLEEIRGIVIRTNAQDKDNESVYKEFEETLLKWNDVRKDFATKVGTGLLSSADGKFANFINTYLPHSDVLITNDSTLEKIAKEKYSFEVKHFDDCVFFDFESLDKELEVLDEERVNVTENINFKIDYTEACTFIDVNSGGYKKYRNEDDAKLKINVIASKEILRQISLRNIGGPIIIDFISLRADDVQTLIETLVEETKNDRQKTVVYREITNLGMVEMERKRTYRRIERKDFDIMFSKRFS